MKSWADAKSQKGAYKILDNATKCADQNPGYKVFDADGKVVYEPKAEERNRMDLIGFRPQELRMTAGGDCGLRQSFFVETLRIFVYSV